METVSKVQGFDLENDGIDIRGEKSEELEETMGTGLSMESEEEEEGLCLEREVEVIEMEQEHPDGLVSLLVIEEPVDALLVVA